MVETSQNIGALAPNWWKDRATEAGETKTEANDLFTKDEVIRYVRSLRTLLAHGSITPERFDEQLLVYMQIAVEKRIPQRKFKYVPNPTGSSPHGGRIS